MKTKKVITVTIAAIACSILFSCGGGNSPESLAKEMLDVTIEMANLQEAGKLDEAAEAKFKAKFEKIGEKVQKLPEEQQKVVEKEYTKLFGEYLRGLKDKK